MKKNEKIVAEVTTEVTPAKVYKFPDAKSIETRLAEIARGLDSHQSRLLAELIAGDSWSKDIVCQRARTTNGNLANLLSSINRGECSLLQKLRDAFNVAMERGDINPAVKFPTLRQLDNKKRGKGNFSIGEL